MQNLRVHQIIGILICGLCIFIFLQDSLMQPLESLVKKGQTIEQDSNIVYLPSSYDTYKEKYFPIIVIFAPGGDASNYIRFWSPIAEKYQLILYASKLYHNDMTPIEFSTKPTTIYNSIAQTCSNYRIDTRKIIYTGISGGGSFSYYMHYYTPSVAYGLIINTGRMWEDSVYEPIAKNIAEAKTHMNNQVKIAMLASPTDFRYLHMKRDKALIDKLGWNSIWLEFNGGHTLAPYETYYQALDWILQN